MDQVWCIHAVEYYVPIKSEILITYYIMSLANIIIKDARCKRQYGIFLLCDVQNRLTELVDSRGE